MAFTIKDKNIDEALERIKRQLEQDFGIKNASKVDAIRYILKMRKQGKKTHRKWKKIVY